MSNNGYSISSRLGAPTPVAPVPSQPANFGAAPAAAPPTRADAGRQVDRDRLNQLKTHVQRWLVDVLNPGTELERGGAQLRGLIDGYLDQVLAEQGMALTRADR